MLEILNGTKQEIKKNIGILAADYKEKTGRKVCLSCPSDVSYMISSLKLIYKMKNFKFKKEFAQYKNRKGDKTTISNSTMTDKKAIEFLKTDSKRIKLFIVYPKNWKELVAKNIKVVGFGAETLSNTGGEAAAVAAAIEAAKSAEAAGKSAAKAVSAAEAAAVALAAGNTEVANESTEVAGTEAAAAVAEAEASAEAAVDAAGAAAGAAAGGGKDCCDEGVDEHCKECIEKKRLELDEMTVKELQKAYSDCNLEKKMLKPVFIQLILDTIFSTKE